MEEESGVSEGDMGLVAMLRRECVNGEAAESDRQLPVSEPDQRYELTSIGAALTIRQLSSQGLSFQLWPAATSLVSLLDRNPNLILSSLRRRAENFKILELGSGTGLAGIAAAAILGAGVTLTDMAHVLPNLQFNAKLNADAVAARGGTVDVRRLEWGNHAEESLPEFDLILASDVVYHDHLFDPLLKTLDFLVNGEVVFVMAHLRRWKKDGLFFRKARKLFEISVIHSDAPLPGSRVGIVVYLFVRRANAKK